MRALIVACLLSVSFATPVWARSADKKAKAKALALFNKGETHYQQGEFRKALSYYRKAHKTYRAPAFIFNIAQCQRQLKQYSKALFFYQLFLAEQPQASNRAEVNKFIRQMRKKLKEQKRVRRSMGRLSVITEPSGAAVYVDRVKGTPNATSPAIVAVAAGEHLIMVKKAGYKTVHKTVTVKARKIVMLKFTLERSGTARVVTPPPDRRVTPPPDRRVTPPPDGRVTSPPDGRVTPPPDGGEPTGPKGSAPFYKRWWFWTGAGVAVLAIAVAGITGSEALSMKSEWDDLQGAVDDPDAYRSKVKTLGALTDVMIGVGAAAAIGVTVGAILAAMKRGKEKQSAMRVTPGCGPTGCGLWVTGRF